MSTLELQAIGKSYGGNAVLRDISLQTKEGEFLAVVGPSGCGKSTLLRIVAGLERQDRGTVRLDGTCIDAQQPKQRNVAMVFQSYALYPHMTVAQNIALPLVMRDLSRVQRLPGVRWLARQVRDRHRSISASVLETGRLLQLETLLGRKPAHLSGGQRQRVALARALVRQPRLFLLDEPLSNLDAALRAEMRNEIVRLQRRMGVTTVLVTHDQVEAMTMADRMAVIFDGRIAQLGTPTEIYDNPASLAVARFVGTPKINVLAATADDRRRLWLSGQPLRMALPPAATQADIRIAIRPEHVSLEAPGRDGTLTGVVRHVEHLGSETLAYVHLPDVSDVAVRLGPKRDAPLCRDERVSLRFTPEHVHFFAATGKRLGTCVPALPAVWNASA